MPSSIMNDGLSFRREGSHTRVTSDRINYLLVDSDPDEMVATYAKFVDQARDHLRPRWKSFQGPNLDEADFAALTRKMTLDAMYFLVINKMPLTITSDEWNSTQAQRSIRAVVEQRFPKDAAKAADLGAHLMNLSAGEYRRWIEADDRYLDR